MVAKGELPNPLNTWLKMPLDYFLNAYTHRDIHVPADDLAKVISHAFRGKSPDCFKQILTVTQVSLRALPKMTDHSLEVMSHAFSTVREEFDEVKNLGPSGLETYHFYEVLTSVVDTVIRDRAERSNNA